MNGYNQKTYACKTKRYVQTLDLRDDPDMIKEYRIYILGTRLVMIVDAPEDFDWPSAMDRLATLPRQAEWEAFVARLQGCRADARSDEKWQMMERMFYLYE